MDTVNGSAVYRDGRPLRVMTVRMPAWLYDALMCVAHGKGHSGNSLAVEALRAEVQRHADYVPPGVQLDLLV